MTTGRAAQFACLCVFALLACGCDRPPPGGTEPTSTNSGDDLLAGMRGSGRLRALADPLAVAQWTAGKRDTPLTQELTVLERFAAVHDAELEIIAVKRKADLDRALLAGEGDIIAARHAVTGARREQLDFSVPFEHLQTAILGPPGSHKSVHPKELRRHSIGAIEASAAWVDVEAVAQQYPGIELLPLDDQLDIDARLNLLADGGVDRLAESADEFAAAAPGHPAIRVVQTLPGERLAAFAIRKGQPEALLALDRFLERELLARVERERSTGDLPEVRARGSLRIALRDARGHHYLWKGEQRGFQYELAHQLAEALDLRLDVVRARDRTEALAMVADGRADIVGGLLRPQAVPKGLAATAPYLYVQPSILTRADEPRPESLEVLSARPVFARPGTPVWDLLKTATAGTDLPRAVLVPIATQYTPSQLLDQVASGQMPFLVSAEASLALRMSGRTDIVETLEIGEQARFVWYLRASNPALREAISKYFSRSLRGLEYNLLLQRYVESPNDDVAGAPEHPGTSELSPFDREVRRFATQYGFDWRLIVALMFEESRFNPRAKSSAGALGLMQVLPATAAQFGIDDLLAPERAIEAGVRYLDWLRERFERDLRVEDRLWFALASYNAGVGHVRDARILARQQGLDPDRWFGQVEKALRLLEQPKFAEKARYGYVRGGQTVRYVREVRARYHAYLEFLVAAEADIR